MDQLNIQWYPGHMTKARRMMEESVRNTDAVCEILDARIPNASRNPEIDSLAAGKPRLIVLNRADLADPVMTTAWKRSYAAKGFAVIDCDARGGKGTQTFPSAVRELLSDRIAASGSAWMQRLNFWIPRGSSGRSLTIRRWESCLP